MNDLIEGITFIVAAYNVENTLQRCVATLQAQVLENVEIIVVNDKSTDNTLDIAYKLCREDSLCRTICVSHLNNLGLPAVRNTGVDIAKMKYIWHVDGDDYLGSIHSAQIVLSLLQQYSLPALKINLFRKSESSQYSEPAEIMKNYLRFFKVVHPSYLESRFGHGASFSVIYSKELADMCGIRGIEDISIGEDQILNAQIFKTVPAIGFLDLPIYVYDQTGESMMRKSWGLHTFLEDRLYIHFLCITFSSEPTRANSALSQRTAYVLNRMISRSKMELNSNYSYLMKLCYLSDADRLRNNHADFNFKNPKFTQLLEEARRTLASSCPQWDIIFDDLFNKTEFILHVGAHKTATTYIQNLLEYSRYDLALEGVVFVNYLELRAELNQIKQQCIAEKKLFTLTKIQIYKIIIKLASRLLFKKPKRVIISDENIIQFNQSVNKHNYRSNLTCACYPSGFNLSVLESLVAFLPNCTVVYAIRTYSEYIQSQYLERIKWHPFTSFEDFCDIKFSLSNVSWMPIIRALTDLTDRLAARLWVYQFEHYKENPRILASILAGTKLSDINIEIKDSFRRKSPSAEVYSLLKKANNHLSGQSHARLYQKLLSYGYGSSKLHLFSQKEKSILEKRYLDHIQQIPLQYLDTFTLLPDLPGENSFQTLSSKPFGTTYIQVDKIKESDDTVEPIFKTNYLKTFESKIPYRNIEAFNDYNFCFTNLPKETNEVTCLLRVKNEEKNIAQVIRSCLNVFDKLVVIDNLSDDMTPEIVRDIIGRDSNASKMELHTYPFEVARCGVPHFNCPEKSVHSLAYFYNYSLSRCSTSDIFKWDGDMLITSDMIEALSDFIRDYQLAKEQFPDFLILGRPKGLTVYRGHDSKYYFFPRQVESEVRLFENVAYNSYVKDIVYERLNSTAAYRFVDSTDPVFIEYKDVEQDEFSHWNPGVFGFGIRKRTEYENYSLISRLTDPKNNFCTDDLIACGAKLFNQCLDSGM